MEDKLFDVSGRVVIITGGLGLIGSELVKAFHTRGSKVAVFSRSVSREKAEAKLGKEIAGSPSFAMYKVDIQSKAQINEALDAIEKSWGTPKVLINNAGIDTPPNAPPDACAPFEEFSEEIFREVVNVNLVGTFLMIQQVGSRMVKAGVSGSIINVASTYGMVSPNQDMYAYKLEEAGIPFVKPVSYSASKSGIYNLTRYCATYWAKKGIRVNTFTPGGVWNTTQDDIFRKNYAEHVPMGRLADKSEYSGGMIFLASDASSYMTGANLVMDGGWTAW